MCHYVARRSLMLFLLLLINVTNADPRVDDPGQRIGRLEYTVTGPEKVSLFDQKDHKNGLSYLMHLFENRQILDPILQMFSSGEKDPFEEASQPPIIQPIMRPPRHQPEDHISHRMSAAKTMVMSQHIPMRVQADAPLPSFSNDQAPSVFEKPPDMLLPPISSEWKSTLFGPKGIFTEIFHFVNEKRKQTLQKVPQADLPPSKEFDFVKLLDGLFLKSQTGNFDEPLPELPFIGICNRLSCGDIYKAIDEFKKSELFSNFQTALSLIQDPKGWDIIGQLLENPELIENFAGKSGNSIQELWGKIAGAKTSSGVHGPNKYRGDMEILPEDGDLGTDFTYLVEEKKGPPKIKKPNEKELPEIALNIDEAPDYYSAVDKGGDEVIEVEEKAPIGQPSLPKATTSATDYYAAVRNAKSEEDEDFVDVEETIPIPTRAPSSSTLSTTSAPAQEKIDLSIDSIPLPEISESIDSIPEEFSVITVNKEVEEKIPHAVPPSKNQTSYEMSKEVVDSKAKNEFERRFVSPVTTTGAPSTVITTATSQSRKIKRKRTRTTATPSVAISTTTKNFRRNDDYYAMYYDDG